MAIQNTPHEEVGIGVFEGVEEGTKEPSMYQVIIYNDDFTPMDFVVEVIEKVFHKSNQVSHKIMSEVHLKGQGVCGVYTFDIAKTKSSFVEDLAKKSNYPLKCSFVKDA